jgi:hypothetical protein
MFSVVATILLGSENPIKLPIHGGSFDEKNPSCDSYSKCSGLHGDYDPTSGGKFWNCSDVFKESEP